MANDLNIEIVPLSEIESEDKTISKPVILVVDDETVIADTLSVILSRNGFMVLTAYDGKGALELARMCPPNLLLTDVVMPGLTGIELAVMLTNAYPKCKVLLFSGQAATVDLLASAKEQGYDFNLILKPIHPSDLLRRISDCFSGEDLNERQFEPPERSSIPVDDHAVQERPEPLYSAGARRPAPTGGASRSTGSMTSPANWERRMSSSVRSK
jgi:DNA-binding NtrC family response regulator